jgi:hypothetical protein
VHHVCAEVEVDRFGEWRDVVRGITPPQFRKWELGALEGIDPRRLLRDENDSVGRLFLTLAAVFNDLKGMVIFEGYLLDYGQPNPGQPTPELAQWRGMQTQVHRCIAGVLFELMNVLTHSRTRAALASAELPQLLDIVADETRVRWDSLISDAPTHAPLANARQSLLHQLRNCVAFHYDQVSLARSFLDAFVAQPATSLKRRALFSYGPDMDGTRYHYADAAQQRLFLALADGRTEAASTDAAVVEIAVQVNEALAPLIRAFIRHRADAPAP